MKSTWEIERRFICELFLEHVFEVPELLREVQTARAGIRRKGQKAELTAGTLERIESALVRLQRAEDELRTTKDRLAAVNASVERARQAYQAPSVEVPHKARAAAAVRELGISTGKAEPRHNERAEFEDYRTLIDIGCFITEPSPEGWEPRPMPKHQAVEELTKKYGHNSFDATRQALKREQKRREARGWKFPRGFIPGPIYKSQKRS